MSRDIDKLITELRVVAEGLYRGLPPDPTAPQGASRQKLPGWAMVVDDARATIEELAEISRLRSENRKLLKERTALNNKVAALARVNYALRKGQDL